MDAGHVILTLARVYSALLVTLGLLTIIWVLNPAIGESPEVAGLWFALGGFGLLVGLTLYLVHASR